MNSAPRAVSTAVVCDIGSADQGFKVTNARRTKTVGIACTSLASLLDKASDKFQVNRKEVRLYLSDGTLVDSEEYFRTIPPQSVLSLVSKDENFSTGADLIYNALKLMNVQYLEAGKLAQDFLQEDIKDKIRVLSNLVESQESEQPFEEWLQGVETSCKTKEAFMESRCKDRIKSYFYKASLDVKSSSRYQTHSLELDGLLNELKTRLTRHGHQGVYFNRSREEALCDKTGLFKCQGPWSKSKCNHCGGRGHTINPYLTRETRIVFSTWNLDHRIERSRSIVPTVLDAVTLLNKKGAVLNVDRIYELLFTTSNLKLVHIICHDKGAHSSAICDPQELISSVQTSPKKTKSSSEFSKKLVPTAAS